jgi:uncharacterized membrane protein YhaH (DUF805 family)
MSNIGPLEVSFLFIAVVLIGIPAFVLGKRRGVSSPGLGFIPVVGAWIVVLRSINRSGWMCLLSLVPIIGVGFAVWVAFVMPAEHGRTRWWALPLLIPFVQIATFWVYAFTLQERRAAALGSPPEVLPTQR